MKVIISPAKTMNIDNDTIIHKKLPVFIEDTKLIMDYLQKLDYQELKSIWKASDKIARLNFQRIKEMDLYNNLTPAILSFEGLQYQYMSPGISSYDELNYLEKHLRIISGFYGILSPLDGITPYRLEMQSRLMNWEHKNLYEFWGDKIAKEIFSDSDTILNLASVEYSKSISRYIDEGKRLIKCTFAEVIDGKLKEKGTFAKMARGDMVRFMATNSINNIYDIREYRGLNYKFNNELSSRDNFIFIKEK